MAKIDPHGVPSTPIKKALAFELGQPSREGKPPPTASATVSLAPPKDSPDKIRKSAFTSADLKANDRTIDQLAEAVGVDGMAWSSINRAMWMMLRQAVDDSDDLRRHAPRLTRPPTGDLDTMARFEEAMADYLKKLIKHARSR